MASINPFSWGSNGEKSSPSRVKKYSEIAAALAAKSGAPQNLGEGLARVGDALLYNSANSRAAEGEAEGAASRKAVLDALMSNPDPSMTDIAGAMGNEWVSSDPGSSAVVQALMAQENQQNDWAHDAALRGEDRQFALDDRAAQQEFAVANREAGWAHDDSAPVVINDQLVKPGDTPTVLGDYRTPVAPKPPAVETLYDDNGRAQPSTWDGTKWVSVGGAKAAASPMVTVNNGDNSGAFNKKSDELAATRLGDIVTSGQGASQLMGDIKTLAALGTQIDTGKGAEVMNALGPFAQALGVDIQGLPEGQAYQSVIDRMAPNLRPVGSGSSSDTDVRMFLNSLPGLGKTPEGNKIIIDTLSALQQHKLAAAEIAGLSFSPSDAPDHISWQEAEKRIRELPDPYEGFNAYKDQVEKAGAPAAPGAVAAPQTAGGQGGAPEITAVNPATGERIVLRNGQWVPAQ